MAEALTGPAAALALAVQKAGGQAALARLLGIKQPSVWRWLHHRKPLPPQHVLKVEQRYGISRHELRPDIYPLGTEPAPPASFGPLYDQPQ